ncbi:aminopeptidase [Pediococcus siamensis]|uniref:aminopeptidase n=1 Tax=Pediococcus siamensis TaxID=381829 RepID=UPI0039A05886
MAQTTFEHNLQKYADLITQVGVNVQPGQTILLYAAVQQAPLARLITKAAYKLGASEVILNWQDTEIERQFLQHAPQSRLQQEPDYAAQRAQQLADKRASRVSLISAAPDAYAGIASDRIAMHSKAAGQANAPLMKVTTNNDISWLVVAAADVPWAEKVFPDLHGQAAVTKLWAEIFKTTLVDQPDPVAAWQTKIAALNERANWLNAQQFEALHYSAPQTDLTVGLPHNHVWEAAGSHDTQGNFFVPNMPTEEVFTAPDNRHIDGTIVSTKPLSYNGAILKDLQITFKNGRVVAAHASQGDTVLQQLLATDDGAKSLGEVSLVPDQSPISQSGIIFYNTLFDENASDHIAFGQAYPFNLKGGTKLSAAELAAHGINSSQTHVDFMVGSSHMNIDGLKADGTSIPVFRDGNWAE